MEDRTIAYRDKMQAMYADEAVAKFRQEHWPADFSDDGVLINAMYLDVETIAVIYKAAQVLRSQRNGAFAENLVLYKPGKVEGQVFTNAMLRVNPLWLDRQRQTKLQICKLLHTFYSCDSRIFAETWKEIDSSGDDQLREYLRQAEEALELTASELEVIVGSDN